MAEITVGDLLAWDSGLSLATFDESYSNGGAMASELERELSWTVSLRASMPVLPQLRGHEVVLMPNRTLTDAGVDVNDVVAEVAHRGATGVVVESPVKSPHGLLVLEADAISLDMESDINRMLTQQRGQIYRVGTDLGRELAQASAAGATVARVVDIGYQHLGIGVAVVDPTTGSAVTVGDSLDMDVISGAGPDLRSRGWVGAYFVSEMQSGNRLWIGPVLAEQRPLARLASERLVAAVDSAVAHAADVRPRGSARARAIAGLLEASQEEAGPVATALGLPVGGHFVVATAGSTLQEPDFRRLLAATGFVHESSDIDGRHAALIEVPEKPVGTALRRDRSPSWRTSAEIQADERWLVMSEPVSGTARIPIAARQARFLAMLVERGTLPKRMLRFDQSEDVGSFRLLYSLWGSSELERFAADTLGDLVDQDKRGTLKETLLVYLESGGSQVEAADRLRVHRNTLSYRLKQIAQLTGRNPVAREGQLSLHLALLAQQLPPAPPN